MGNKPSSCSSDEGAKATTNRPFPSSKKSHFQNEAKCEAIDMEITFNYYANKTHFHNKGFALSLVLKLRFLELGNGLLKSTGEWEQKRR